MKNIYTLVLALFCFGAIAQEHLNPPASWYYEDLETNDLATYNVGTFDHEVLEAEDNIMEQETGKDLCGRVLYEAFDTQTSGTWTKLPDGGRIWRMRFESPNALAVSAYFGKYHIPDGAGLWVWSADKSYFVGPYTSEDNNDHGKMATLDVYGAEAIIEYYEPADVVGTFELETLGFGHFYDNVHDYREESQRGGSASCEIDVNCPEGDGWQAQRDATVWLRMTWDGFISNCSGVMVNNADMDCDQLMLTAYHCTDVLQSDDFPLLIVRFNYERSGCDAGGLGAPHSRTGVIHLADSDDNGGQTGSDFAIFRVEDDIPEEWPIFYAGWDATGLGATSGVGIHHPSGDIKKVSTFTAPLISDTWWFANGAHWSVTWAETVTNHGVTEPGSSGSPIFSPDGLVVGTLTGGGSCCEGKSDPNNGCFSPTTPDLYGKFSYHWDGNTNATDDLQEILDPNNTGLFEIFGAYAPNCDQVFVDVPELNWDQVGVFPNPTNDMVNFSIEGRFTLSTIAIYDAMGSLVRIERPVGNKGVINIEDVAPGVYYMTFTTQSNQQVTKKVTKL